MSGRRGLLIERWEKQKTISKRQYCAWKQLVDEMTRNGQTGLTPRKDAVIHHSVHPW